MLPVDRTRLLPADAHFNPSLGVVDDELWLVYRRVIKNARASSLEWPRRVAACRLDAELQPVQESNVDLSARIVDPPNAHRWHADADFPPTATICG